MVNLDIPEINKVTGKVLTCGQGEMGQLGLGEDVMEKTRPALVEAVKNAVMVRAGGMHVVVLDRDGVVYSFGCNDEGALGRTTAEQEEEFEPGKVSLPAPGVQLTAGDSHSGCLLKDGRVFIWGTFRNSHGSIGLTMAGKQAVPVEALPGKICVAIASGADHILMLTNNGELYSMGSGEQGQLGRISANCSTGDSRRGMSELLQPSRVHSRFGQFVDRIWATNSCSFYRDMKTQTIYGFGLNNNQQIAAAGKGDRAKNMLFKPILTKFSDVHSLSGGLHHTMSLSTEGQVFVIGRRDYGRLGLGEELKDDVTELTEVKALKKKVSFIGCGDSTSFAITADGEVFSWGMGSNNQLGHGNDSDCYEPKQIVSAQTKDKKMLQVDSGGQHSVFLVESGEAVTAAAPKSKK